jgi:hypothetical protein
VIDGPTSREMLDELSSMEYAVTSDEATFLQDVKGVFDRELDPEPVQLVRLREIYGKYVGDIEGEIDL